MMEWAYWMKEAVVNDTGLKTGGVSQKDVWFWKYLQIAITQSARLIYTSPKVKPWGFVNGKIAKPLRHPQNARVGFFAGIEDQNIIP